MRVWRVVVRVVSGVRRVVSVRIWLWGVSGVWVRGGKGRT